MTEPRVIGRYALHAEVAHGGMATVHLGRLLGPVGFARTVAIKRLYPQFAKDPEFTTMFLDEARLAARIRHPNVVPTLDVVALEGELFLVMEYVQGESLAYLIRSARDAGELLPLGVVSNVMSGLLQGLHAAHQATGESGEPLGIVHRDVSPQNVLVGIDGVSRVLDFGIAKAAGRSHTTREGQIKGKLAYMAPEQIAGGAVSRQTDVFAASVVLWEALTGQKLFGADSEAETLHRVLSARAEAPSRLRAEVPKALDLVVLRGLMRVPAARFATALEMAEALEAAYTPSSNRSVGQWVERAARERLSQRAAQLAALESGPRLDAPQLREAAATPTEPATEPEARPPDSEPALATVDRTSRSRWRGAPRVLALVLGAAVVAGLGIAFGRSSARETHAADTRTPNSPMPHVTAPAPATTAREPVAAHTGESVPTNAPPQAAASTERPRERVRPRSGGSARKPSRGLDSQVSRSRE